MISHNYDIDTYKVFTLCANIHIYQNIFFFWLILCSFIRSATTSDIVTLLQKIKVVLNSNRPVCAMNPSRSRIQLDSRFVHKIGTAVSFCCNGALELKYNRRYVINVSTGWPSSFALFMTSSYPITITVRC